MLALVSDFNQNSSVPPPPPPPPAPPTPFGYSAPGAAPQGYPLPGTGLAGGQPAQKPPRPSVPAGSWLLIIGGVLLIAGSFLNWFTLEGEKFTGFSGSGSDTKDGPVFVFFGVLAFGFGLAQLLARRVLAVAILAIIFAVFAVLAAIVDLRDVADAMDLSDTFGFAASQGPGLWVVLVGSLLALAGGVATLAKRRR